MRKFITGLVLVGGAAGACLADTTADVTAIATDASTLFGTVTTIAISIVTLGVLLFIVRKIRGR